MPIRSFISFTTITLMSLAAAALIALTGCGVAGSLATPDPSVPVPGTAISGKALGGGIPITGSRVTLWETSSNGYPGSSSKCFDAISGDAVYSTLCAATSRSSATSIALATTTTNANGRFGFVAGSYTCDSGQFMYITATGGNTGAGVNTQSVQIAPLGSCSNFQTTAQENQVSINMGEATTVATAYTLGNFMYVTDNGTGVQVVYISAPATNNATAGSCTSPSGATAPPNTTSASLTYAVTCTSAGLSHAFANAANIMDAVHFDGSSATGAILAAPVSNASGSVPRALMNTVANALEACTNTASTASAYSGGCTKLFAATTSSTSTNGSASTAPTNELQAVLNLVKDPASSSATSNTAGIFMLSTPQGSSFTPALSVAPTDYSAAIWFPGTSASTFGYPVDAAIDANDNVYVLVSDAVTPTMSGVASLASNGSTNFAATSSTAYCAPGQIATDTVGDVWASNNTTATTGGCISALVQYSAANGSVTSTVTSTSVLTPYGLAVDRYNDVWFARNNNVTTSTANIRELLYSNGGSSGGSFSLSTLFTNTSNGFGYGGSLAIDSHQDVWLGSAAVAGTQPSSYSSYVLPNIATTNIPWYGTSSNQAEAAIQTTLPGTAGNGIAIDANGNAWSPTAGNLSKIVPSYSSPVSFAISKYSVVYGSNSDEFEGTSTANPYNGAVPGAFILSGFPTSTFLNGATVGITVGSDKSTAANGTLYPAHAAVGSTTEAGTATVPSSINAAAATNYTTTTTAPTSKAEFDGAGALWYANNAASSSIYYFQPSSSVSVSLSPCYLAGAATTCTASPYSLLNGFAIDSTGSVWVSVNSAAGSTGGVLQLLGSASPTVPQLSAGYPATKP